VGFEDRTTGLGTVLPLTESVVVRLVRAWERADRTSNHHPGHGRLPARCQAPAALRPGQGAGDHACPAGGGVWVGWAGDEPVHGRELCADPGPDLSTNDSVRRYAQRLTFRRVAHARLVPFRIAPEPVGEDGCRVLEPTVPRADHARPGARARPDQRPVRRSGGQATCGVLEHLGEFTEKVEHPVPGGGVRGHHPFLCVEVEAALNDLDMDAALGDPLEDLWAE
jgi:hypothetical protein